MNLFLKFTLFANSQSLARPNYFKELIVLFCVNNNPNLFLAAGAGHWIQVDLRAPTRVVAVVTQGINYPGTAPDRLSGYKISYGNATDVLQVVQNTERTDLV